MKHEIIQCRWAKTIQFLAFVCLLAVLGGCGFASQQEQLTVVEDASSEAFAEEQDTQTDADAQRDASVTQASSQTIYVHVCGAVKHAGVYALAQGSRVVDAVTAAGGFAKRADSDRLNQAELVSDGQRLYIPAVGETVSADSVAAEDGAVTNEESASVRSDGKVNINTADAAALMTLPGIGEAKADAILAYREEHGSFQTIDELKQISGIKDGVFNKIKDYITVG
jgi:competence protein ComEA